MKTTKKNPTRRRPWSVAGSDDERVTLTAAAWKVVTLEMAGTRAKQRQQFVAWWARIMTEIEVVRDSLQAGSVSRWEGILTDDEQLTLDCKLDRVWGMLANAIPKAVPAELADVIADVEARDRVT